MKEKVFAYLQLMRFPNIFTAVADVLAGCLIVKGFGVEGSALSALLFSSAFIYGGGCILNDIQDRSIDGKERPERPIPSGRVSLREASALCIAFFALGLLLAHMVGTACLVTALLLVFLVCCYDVLTKQMNILGPLNMGACRGVNLLLGLSISFDGSGAVFLYPFISLIYVFAVTILSRFEVKGGLTGKGRLVWGSLLTVLLILLILLLAGQLSAASLVYLGFLTAFTVPFVMLALSRPAPRRIGKAVKYLILGIPLLDAVYVSGGHGFFHGLPVALCVVPSMFFSRYLYVT